MGLLGRPAPKMNAFFLFPEQPRFCPSDSVQIGNGKHFKMHKNARAQTEWISVTMGSQTMLRISRSLQKRRRRSVKMIKQRALPIHGPPPIASLALYALNKHFPPTALI